MLYLIAHIWLWMVVAAALGFVVGWLLRWEDVTRRINRMEDDILAVRAERDRLQQKNRLMATRSPTDAAEVISFAESGGESDNPLRFPAASRH